METLSDGSKVKSGKPGITYKKGNPKLLYMFVQSGIVIAIEKGALSTADHTVVTITSAGGEAVQITYSFAYGGTIYADITDVVRSMVIRTLPTSSTPSSVGTALTGLDVELFDDTDTAVDNTSFDVRAIDGLDYAYDSPGAKWPGIPDRVRLYTITPLTFLTNGSDGESTVVAKNGTYIGTLDNNGQAATFLSAANTFEVVDNGVVAASCEIEWVDCESDKVTLRWWSPELGGWKSYVWDVVEQGQDVDRVTLFDRLFARNAAANASLWLRLRAPLCSMRDWLWLRDISVSDEVEMIDMEKIETGGSTNVWRSVTVSPASSAWKIRDIKDFDIVVTTAEASSL